MKKVLKAVGGFFVGIWNWIKNTAWVQPLLIVGIIFGVIFSIRPIVDGITNAVNSQDTSMDFYKNAKKSLNKAENSAADKLIDNIYAKHQDASVKSEYGEKFFVAFVSNSCSECKSARPGFEYLKAKFKKSYKPDDGRDFKLYTIFTDETTDETTTRQSAFVQFLDRQSAFFEEAGEVAINSQYYMNDQISKSDIDAMANADRNDFLTPTIILVDYEVGGISEVMFGVGSDGDTKYEKAQLLLDCWNHKGDFAEK